MKRSSLFLLGLIVLTSSALSFFMLTRGHFWGDDFAAYIMQARAILSGSMAEFVQRNAFTIHESSYPQGPVAYPWGFPLLLTPFYAIFGLNPLGLKLAGVAFYALFLIVFYFFARTRLMDKESLLLTGLLALNPSLLLANDLILSDLPFLAFSTLGILLAEMYTRSPKSPDFGLGLALGATIFIAFFIRSSGFMLLFPLAILLLMDSWPNWREALKRGIPPALSLAVLQILNILIFPGGQESYFSHFSMFTLQRLLENILYYLWLPWRMFELLPGGVIIYPLLAVFLLFSLRTHWRRDLPIYTYCALTVMMFMLWPERQGLRFIYPVLPFLLVLAFDGMQLSLIRLRPAWQKAGSWATAAFWSVLLLLSLGVSANLAYVNLLGQRDINGPFDVYSYDLYEFIRDETPTDSVIIFGRPRALRLFTNRDSFMTTDCANLPKGNYLVIHEKLSDQYQIPLAAVTTCNPSVTLETVFSNRRIKVYKINPK